ncbi:A/G-specific adenine glycosylase [Alkaliphilus metalliredigens QYMF]|uniref:Adenine DNA glycosylase n=1 Tax=Alkaliphilus metalliredigens (strain QYMF) TaxID=293826 RepID=A6TW33_ALKMQ|nr:A/G-specific adenine glycosylase [Alkaliphilus metalliredigens]ABR50401.1 A/G-specific adenine glycosylase [Alkaliphilus metalliredigens QYMF]
MTEESFSYQLIEWFREEKRWMPWRETKDPYCIWVSEIMLQQTRVETVISYYQNFMKKFPTIETLARASQEEVLKSWEGLGYYSRGRNLHRAANEIVLIHEGNVPKDKKILLKLPGIGPYTAGAILSIAYNQKEPAVDGNVLRVMSRLFNIQEDIMEKKVVNEVTDLVFQLMPQDNGGDFTEALMELGATVCVPQKPRCRLCPVHNQCKAHHLDIQETLPIRIKKTKVKNYHKGILWMVYNGTILVKQNPQKGLLGGLWALPTIDLMHKVDEKAVIQEDFQEEVGQVVVELEYIGKEKHVFTHQRWQMSIFKGRSNDHLRVKEPYQWVPIGQLETLTFPIVYRKVIDKIDKFD